MVEMRQWEDAEAAWARDREASRLREEGLGVARGDAEAARERAELRAEEALSELRKRDGERQVCMYVCLWVWDHYFWSVFSAWLWLVG